MTGESYSTLPSSSTSAGILPSGLNGTIVLRLLARLDRGQLDAVGDADFVRDHHTLRT